MKIMFKVKDFYSDRIERHEVLQATDRYVFLADKFNNTSEARALKKGVWFDTWAQAYDFSVSRALLQVEINKLQVESNKIRLQHAMEILAAIQAMKEPL